MQITDVSSSAAVIDYADKHGYSHISALQAMEILLEEAMALQDGVQELPGYWRSRGYRALLDAVQNMEKS